MSDWSAADTLAGHLTPALAPCRVEPLLSLEAVRRISEQTARHFPGLISTLYGFECRLDEAAADADFLISVGPESEQWQLLSRSLTRIEGTIWQRLRDFLGPEAAAGRPPHNRIRNLWLEFDLAGAASSGCLPTPSVFLGGRLTSGHATTTTLLQDAAWLPASIAALTASDVCEAQRRPLATCLAALPGDALVFQTGVMLSRPDRGVRLCVLDIAIDDIAPYLQRIGWPGAFDALAAEIERRRPWVDEIRLDLDVTDRVGPGIGLECYWKEPTSVMARAAGFLQTLIEDRLCLVPKAAAALGWYGITHQRRYPEIWPGTLLAQCPSGLSSVFIRWLHHVKVQLAGDGTKRAKAYLAVTPAFVSDAHVRTWLRGAAS